MGSLFYGNDTHAIDIPDRVLAHLKVIIATKLRRGESFTISWKHQDDVAGGRTTLWMHASIPVRFTFDSAEVGFARHRACSSDSRTRRADPEV